VTAGQARAAIRDLENHLAGYAARPGDLTRHLTGTHGSADAGQVAPLGAGALNALHAAVHAAEVPGLLLSLAAALDPDGAR
jgi:hypothetical protein